MKVKPGTRVKVIDEDLEGVVQSQKGNEVTILCVDGFEYAYDQSQLIFIDTEGKTKHIPAINKVPFSNQAEQLSEKSDGFKGIAFKGKKPCFDLHFDELAPNRIVRTNHEMLQFQLAYCVEVIEKAIRSRIRQLVFIHGIGSGRLRKELRQMLKERYPSIEYFDASYKEFGPGATEIVIHGIGKL